MAPGIRPACSARRQARYTRTVGWNLRTISIAMLMVLSLLPFSGTLCAMACDTPAQADGPLHHHGAAPEPTNAAETDGARLTGGPAHPCDHDAAILQATNVASERVQVIVSAPPLALAAVGPLTGPVAQQARAPQGAPPGSAPPTSTPLVLRV
jgi:hypothetical protein